MGSILSRPYIRMSTPQVTPNNKIPIKCGSGKWVGQKDKFRNKSEGQEQYNLSKNQNVQKYTTLKI
jgi:hypothetical protein